MSDDEELARVQRYKATRPPLRGFAAKMADYAATRARLGRSPSPPPESRIPVLISSTRGIVSLPEQIQTLAGLSEPPELITVQHVDVDGRAAMNEPPVTDTTVLLQVCAVTLTMLNIMKRKVEVDEFFSNLVWFNGKRRYLAVVLGAKRVLIS
ncbi:hypothetical protein A9K55_009156 [Cordyceps militaris]|uniref:Uncharacterized protein n=1 Tax=Cordyceps militaris TaxID=73501 RepID=A0A2H4SHL0_CORMI|nr:hypothetical protein A9K55_009156 [Cordyceps militaris]